MNNIDRIFSEKFEGYTSTPPMGTWEKVEATLAKPLAANAWRWAAVLLPIVVATGWMLTRNEPTHTQVANNNTQTSVTPSLVPNAHAAKAASEPVVIRRKAVQPETPITPTLTRVTETIVTNPEASLPEGITIEPIELITEVTEPTPAAVEKEPMVIVITLEAVAAAPDTDKKPLERVAEFAMAVKHSDPIASLRGVKDELLALDLRKKSTKKN